MTYTSSFKLFALSGCLLGLVACENGLSFKPSMYDNTVTTQRPIVIEEKRFVQKLPTQNVTHDYLVNLSNDYERTGSSPIYMVLAYDPDKRNGKLESFTKSSILKGQLAKLGITNTVIKTMPVTGSPGEVVIGYDRLSASGPKNCGEVPGLTTETGSYGDYGLGCTVKDMIAKQVAYPADLEGQSEMSAFDADRAAAPVKRDVRSGEQAEFVPSYILSELAGNTTE